MVKRMPAFAWWGMVVVTLEVLVIMSAWASSSPFPPVNADGLNFLSDNSSSGVTSPFAFPLYHLFNGTVSNCTFGHILPVISSNNEEYVLFLLLPSTLRQVVFCDSQTTDTMFNAGPQLVSVRNVYVTPGFISPVNEIISLPTTTPTVLAYVIIARVANITQINVTLSLTVFDASHNAPHRMLLRASIPTVNVSYSGPNVTTIVTPDRTAWQFASVEQCQQLHGYARNATPLNMSSMSQQQPYNCSNDFPKDLFSRRMTITDTLNAISQSSTFVFGIAGGMLATLFFVLFIIGLVGYLKHNRSCCYRYRNLPSIMPDDMIELQTDNVNLSPSLATSPKQANDIDKFTQEVDTILNDPTFAGSVKLKPLKKTEKKQD